MLKGLINPPHKPKRGGFFTPYLLNLSSDVTRFHATQFP